MAFWHTVESAREQWPDAPENHERLQTLLAVAQAKVIAYAPKRVRDSLLVATDALDADGLMLIQQVPDSELPYAPVPLSLLGPGYIVLDDGNVPLNLVEAQLRVTINLWNDEQADTIALDPDFPQTRRYLEWKRIVRPAGGPPRVR